MAKLSVELTRTEGRARGRALDSAATFSEKGALELNRFLRWIARLISQTVGSCSIRTPVVADMSGFRIRLRVRIPKGLTSEATSLNVMVMNKDVTITSQNKEEPLNKAKWIILGARGFSTEEAAQHFGTRLRSIVQLAALSSRLGVDAGEDKPTDWMSEDFARKTGL